ncbi:hypothetical protein GCM10022214_05430 [Actinomadura miaoliensis]|uniref:Transposase n=1 Tax=Actinomadura miaoliensis TaxID=430685 RepID=A0ABP7V037_9ACTN
MEGLAGGVTLDPFGGRRPGVSPGATRVGVETLRTRVNDLTTSRLGRWEPVTWFPVLRWGKRSSEGRYTLGGYRMMSTVVRKEWRWERSNASWSPGRRWRVCGP